MALLVATLLPVVAQPTGTEVGGLLATNTTWSPDLGEIRVTRDLLVRSGAVLEIRAGTQVRLGDEVSLVAEDGAGIDVQGEPGGRVRFSSLTGSNLWAQIGARGTGSWIRLRQAEVAHGQCSAYDGATVTLEDSRFQDFVRLTNDTLLNAPILVTQHAAGVVVRRCHFRGYHEVLLRYSPADVQDSLFEQIRGDGLDLDFAPPGCVIRDCTFRDGPGTNIDGLDIGSSSRGVTVERCVMHDFDFDKGVSIGEGSLDCVVRDCLIYDVESGVSVKDSSQALIEHTTVARAHHGFRFYEKNLGQGGGHAETRDNILWGNAQSVTLDPLSSILVAWSDVEGGYPGTNNLAVDPAFRDPERRDFRLPIDSPLRTAASDGSVLGARFPAGSSLVDSDEDGLPDPWELEHDLDPYRATDAAEDPDVDGLPNRAEFLAGTDPRDASSVLTIESAAWTPTGVELSFQARAGRSYAVECLSVLGAAQWQALTNLPPAATSGAIHVGDPQSPGAAARFYRLAIYGP